LLCGTGLLVRSLAALHRIEPGFRADRLLTMELTVPYPNDVSRAKYIESPGRRRLYAEVLRRTREVSGVSDAAMTSSIPLSGAAAVNTRIITAEGAPATTDADASRFEMLSVSDAYFRTMAIPILDGREFTLDDRDGATPVAVVSETAARRLWPGAAADGPGGLIGRRVKIGPTSSDSVWMSVVGVVRDVRTGRLDVPPPSGQVYASSLQQPPRPVHLVVRARAAAEPLTETIRRTVRQVENDQPVYAVRTMDQILASRLAQRRFAMVSLGTFSALAILLAAIGLYGVIAFSVAQRRREIAVRMALGGTALAIAGLVLRDGMRLALAGAALGVLGVWLSGRALAGLLYGVPLMDQWTLALTVSGLVAVGAAASLIPGRRAAAIDPITALRDE
jgi:predicted permease